MAGTAHGLYILVMMADWSSLSSWTGSRLHKVRQMAPEFYMDIPHYYSWAKVLYDFVNDPAITPYNRIKRVTMTKEAVAALATQGVN